MLKQSIFALIIFFIASAAFADTGAVYKVDQNGVPEFVSKAPNSSAKPEALPKIGHWKIDNSAADVKATCDSHGGIDCAAGADADGSVICRDKFKDSLQRFNFECTAAKLNVVQISDLDSHGNFKVTLRNSKAVAAKKSSVSFKLNHMDDGVKLSGPEQIDAYGIGEFEFHADPKTKLIAKPKESQLVIACGNCD